MNMNSPRNIVLACQGGGSLTAFTAGVLKVLLTELDPRRYRISGLSGTSGGAMCAAIAWYGLLMDNRKEGARRLQQFWEDNSSAQPFDAWLNSLMVFGSWFVGGDMRSELSPYQVPETARERLKTLLVKYIDFNNLATLVTPTSPTLAVSAVNVETGEFKVFSGSGLTVDKILASAALPTMFRAVHLDAGPDQGVYWDGVLSQNPPLRDFLQPAMPQEAKPDEIWIIRIDPEKSATEPTTIAQIDVRRNILTGNLSLAQEIFFINKVNDWLKLGWLNNANFKHIEIRDELRLNLELDEASKIDRSPEHIHMLIAMGEKRAHAFLRALP
jgi:NTE family protein